jgi:hypothetical protein
MEIENIAENVFIDFLNAYNKCFYTKDLEKLKTFYDTKNNRLIYFDNHKNNDTYTVDEHLKLIEKFFTEGKSTESGGVEELIIENINIFNKENAGCMCFIAKYKSFPEPAIRCTYYMEKIEKEWKIIHAHGSFQPNA